MGAGTRSAGFALINDDIVAAVVATDSQEADLVLRVLGQFHGFVGGLDGMTVETLLRSVALIVFCLYLFERRGRDRNLSRALHFCKDE